MSLKRFSIFSSIIVGIMMLITVVINFIVIPTPFRINVNPSSITVYDYSKSSTGKTFSASNSGKETYEKLLTEFRNTTNLTIFERAVSGVNIYSKASQDVEQNQPTWTSAKNKAVTMELNFSEKQSIVIAVDGNTKKIDFYGLAFVVNNSAFVNDIVIYYKTKQSGSYVSSPLIVGAKTNKIYNIITQLQF